jgi:hypothetical protein
VVLLVSLSAQEKREFINSLFAVFYASVRKNPSGNLVCRGDRRVGNRATTFRPPGVEMEFAGEKFKEQFHQPHQRDAVGAAGAGVKPVAEAEKSFEGRGGAPDQRRGLNEVAAVADKSQ